ncbi:hypothetical protein BGX27_005895 [Mortierella sp. AM989]|nr:hypothetical protein BGX27_005895 [Mortierella sp. AM989]
MAAEDEFQPGFTLPRSPFPITDTMNSRSATEAYPMQELLTSEPRQNEHSISVSPEERINGLENLQEIDRPQERRHGRRPRRRFRFISKALPFLLTSLTIYIYYIYVVKVCTLYLVAFNALIVLFFVSYALSIFSKPGSPSDPPVRKQTPSIPATATPYQQRVPSIPSHVGSNERTNPDTALPQSSQGGDSSALPRSRTPSTNTGHSWNAQQASSHLASIVASPKYPTATVAPVGQGTFGYLLPASNDTFDRASHISINIPSEESIHGDNNHSNSGNAEFASGVGGARASIDTQGPGSRSRNTTDESSPQPPIATLSISKRDGRPRWCEMCKTIKPDRCHHCSECNRCVLRMDHHCPWVNGCIGFGNYKYFYLFILYGSLSALWIVASMIPLILQAIRESADNDIARNGNMTNGGNYMDNGTDWAGNMGFWNGYSWEDEPGHIPSFDVQWVVITVIAFLLALLIVSFTGAHTSYILRNRTTIEALQNVRNTFVRVQYRKVDPATDGASGGPHSTPLGNGAMPLFLSEIEFNVVMVDQSDHIWDRGSWLANWCSIMGPTWWLWFVPYNNSLGDGIHEVYNEKVYNRLVTDALAQARMQMVTIGLQNDTNGRLGERAEAIITVPSSPRADSETASDSSSIDSSMNVEPVPSNTDQILSDANQRLKIALSSDSSMPSRPRRNTSAGPSQSIRFEGVDEAPISLVAASDTDFQVNHGDGILGSRSKLAGQRQGPYFDGGSTSQAVPSSGYSTPKQFSSRNQGSKQNSPKPSVSSARRRQRTMSGDTSMSYAGPIREFGMGLGMDGVPVDSGTGLKLSSARMGWSSQSPGRSYPRQQQDQR